MPRRRLGVALLVPEPFAAEVDGLRRALGDPSRRRIPPHLTLVPPVNVRDQDLDQALAVLRSAAARTRTLALSLGPPATFLPVNPVLYLAVGGDLPGLRALRDGVFQAPLERALTLPFVPHVTLADGGDPTRIEAALGALSSYRVELTLDRVTLLEEGEGRVWAPIADATLEAPAVVGRGGLELVISRSGRLEPAALALLHRASVTEAVASGAAPTESTTASGGGGLVLTARRDDLVVGVAAGWLAGPSAHLGALVVDPAARGEGIGSHLLAAFVAEAAGCGCTVVHHVGRRGSPVEGFYRSRGWTDDATAPVVELVRRLA